MRTTLKARRSLTPRVTISRTTPRRAAPERHDQRAWSARRLRRCWRRSCTHSSSGISTSTATCAFRT